MTGGPVLLTWSGRDVREWERHRDRLSQEVTAVGDPQIVAAARNDRPAGTGPYRGAVVADGPAATLAALVDAVPSPARGRPVAVMFPGQGSQHQRMAAGLYGWERTFTAAMDGFFDLMAAAAGPAEAAALRADWLAEHPVIATDAADRAQPLLLAVGHALARALAGRGAPIDVVLGHSMGEMVAAVVAGVVGLPDVVELTACRLSALADLPAGGMLGVAAGAAMVRPLLSDGVVVAAENSPRQTVLAGSEGGLRRVRQRLSDLGLHVGAVGSTVAFHSPDVDGLRDCGLDILRSAAPAAPRIPLYSAYTAGPLDVATACSPEFWAGQVAEPVLFWSTLSRLLDDGDHLVLEAGPGECLTMAARRQRMVVTRRSTVVPLLPARPGPADNDRWTFLRGLASVWLEGHPLRAGGSETATQSGRDGHNDGLRVVSRGDGR